MTSGLNSRPFVLISQYEPLSLSKFRFMPRLYPDNQNNPASAEAFHYRDLPAKLCALRLFHSAPHYRKHDARI